MAERDFFAEEFKEPVQRDFFAEEFTAQETTQETVQEPGLTGLGKVLPTFATGQTPERGERTLLGNIFERPGSAIRSGIRGALTPEVDPQEAFVRGALFPEEVQTFQDEALEKLAPETQSVIINFLGGLPASSAGLAADIATSPADVATALIPGAPGIKQLGKTKIAQQIARFFTKERTLIKSPNKALNQALPRLIDQPIQKALRPSVKGKKTLAGRRKFRDNAREAVQTIVDNKESLQIKNIKTGEVANKLPESLDDFSQAVSQTKSNLFDTWDLMTRQSGEKGAVVNLDNAIIEMKKITGNRVIRAKDPAVVKHAEGLIKRFENLKPTPKEADEAIKFFNNDLKGFYNNPTEAGISKAVVDARFTGKIREALDSAIDSAIGKKFQPIKNKYGSLKAIEADVNRRALSKAKETSSLANLFDTFGISDIATGVLTVQPGRIIRGSSQLIARTIFKTINDPDRIVSQMFKNADKITNRTPSILPKALEGALSRTPKELFPVTSALPGSLRALEGIDAR